MGSMSTVVGLYRKGPYNQGSGRKRCLVTRGGGTFATRRGEQSDACENKHFRPMDDCWSFRGAQDEARPCTHHSGPSFRYLSDSIWLP